MKRYLHPLNVLDVLGVLPNAPQFVAPLRLTNVGTTAYGFVISMYAGSDPIEYSVNGGAWVSSSSGLTINTNPGDYVELRCECTQSGKPFTIQVGGGKFEASGSVMSLLYGKNLNPVNNLVIPSAYTGAFKNLFSNSTGLFAPPELPALSLTGECYNNMFAGCANLQIAPELPAEQLKWGCYWGMFTGCAKLTEAPYLPAETIAGYAYNTMFYGCTLLETVHVALTAWGVNNDTYFWLGGTAASGTFRCSTELDTSLRDASHIPTGWTIEHV